MLNTLPKNTMIAGETGTAKTGLAVNFAVTKTDGKVFYLSSEMGEEDLMKRFSAVANRISLPDLSAMGGTEKAAVESLTRSKTGHIEIINSRAASVSIDYIREQIKESLESGVSKAYLVIDSFTAWTDSMPESNVPHILTQLLELQEDTGVEILLICQARGEEALAPIRHWSDLAMTFSWERGGKTVAGKKTLKIRTVKNRMGDTGTKIVQFVGETQEFLF